MRPDRRALFDRLKEVEGVESWARLAPRLDITETTLYRWRHGKSPISYERTIELLERAGYLNHLAAEPAEADLLAQMAGPLEGAAALLGQVIEILAEAGERPPIEIAER